MRDRDQARDPPAGWEALSPREIRDHVRASVEASLRALRRERLDLLQIHNADGGAGPLGARRRGARRAARGGARRRVGATVYGEADALAAIAAPSIDVVQVPYSALDRRPERRVLPAAARRGTGGGRALAAAARSPQPRGARARAALRAAGGRGAERVRRALGATWAELPGAAVAFVISRPGVACALLGPRDERELAALLDGAERFRAVAREARWRRLSCPMRCSTRAAGPRSSLAAEERSREIVRLRGGGPGRELSAAPLRCGWYASSTSTSPSPRSRRRTRSRSCAAATGRCSSSRTRPASRSRSRRPAGRCAGSPRSTPAGSSDARALLAAGRLELIGSAHAQCVAAAAAGGGQRLEPAPRPRGIRRAARFAPADRARLRAGLLPRPRAPLSARPATRRSSSTGTTPTAHTPSGRASTACIPSGRSGAGPRSRSCGASRSSSRSSSASPTTSWRSTATSSTCARAPGRPQHAAAAR